jgi:hypothetical protein
VTLFEAVDFPSSFPTRFCGVVRSRALKSPVGQHRPMLVVQYTGESTIRMNATNLFDLLAIQHNVIQGEPAEWSALHPTSLSSSRNVDSLVASLSDELRDTRDYLLSVSEAYERSRGMMKAIFDITRKEKQKANENFDDLKGRNGRLHEEVIRHAISIAYGYDWGTSVNITGFRDAVSFVSHGLGKSSLELDKGKNRLMKRFCKGLDTFKFDLLDKLDRKDAENVKAEQEKLQKVYNEVSMKLWVHNSLLGLSVRETRVMGESSIES